MIPTNDSWFDGSFGKALHRSHAILRAVENGRDIVRTGNTGISAVIDAYGNTRVLIEPDTVGHGIESSEGMSELYHGECVALGMIPMCGEDIRPRVIDVLKKCGLYRVLRYDWGAVTDAAFHDKKADGDTVTVVTVEDIGHFEMKKMPCLAVIEAAKACLEGLVE